MLLYDQEKKTKYRIVFGRLQTISQFEIICKSKLNLCINYVHKCIIYADLKDDHKLKNFNFNF